MKNTSEKEIKTWKEEFNTIQVGYLELSQLHQAQSTKLSQYFRESASLRRNNQQLTNQLRELQVKVELLDRFYFAASHQFNFPYHNIYGH